jgi:hypothetical protein
MQETIEEIAVGRERERERSVSLTVCGKPNGAWSDRTHNKEYVSV